MQCRSGAIRFRSGQGEKSLSGGGSTNQRNRAQMDLGRSDVHKGAEWFDPQNDTNRLCEEARNSQGKKEPFRVAPCDKELRSQIFVVRKNKEMNPLGLVHLWALTCRLYTSPTDLPIMTWSSIISRSLLITEL